METNKNDIRKKSLLNRKNLSNEERRIKSDQIIKRLIGNKWFENCKNVLIYASYNNEVYTDMLVIKSIMMGKNVYMPKVNGNEMDFYRVFSLDELCEGAFGIREPYDIEHLKFDGSEASLCIMPLASFDDLGNRVGYGKGYYDRYLSRVNVDKYIGLAFECQKSEEKIVIDEFDKKLHAVITEANEYIFIKEE